MYVKMPFGLMNAGDTFQRAMAITSFEEKYNFVVIYLDNITVFSNSDDEHIKHFEQVLKKCRKFGISLNPKKSNFSMDEGKLPGHVISKDGIKIDPSSVEAILKVDIPRNKKEVQSFIGKVNVLRRFLPNFAEICKVVTNMLRKNNETKWTTLMKQSFSDIKKALMEAPVLVSPYFSKYFIIFWFASEHTVAGVLFQKNDRGEEQQIVFYSKILRDATLK